jgi:hypothetical protein
VSQNPDARFFFTSRSELPTDLQDALGNHLDVQLRDLADDDLAPFLARYLRQPATKAAGPGDSLEQAKKLRERLDERLPTVPRIPLMLRLVADVYAAEGDVPRDLPALFSRYADRLLRKDATGIDDPAGLRFAIRHLVRETYLRNPGSRGVSHTRAVEILHAAKEPLKAFGIDRPAIEVLNILITAGLYRRVGDDYLKFFHDTFESYFGASALVDDFESDRLDFLRTTLAQEALGEVRSLLLNILVAGGRLAAFEARVGKM